MITAPEREVEDGGFVMLARRAWSKNCCHGPSRWAAARVLVWSSKQLSISAIPTWMPGTWCHGTRGRFDHRPGRPTRRPMHASSAAFNEIYGDALM